MAIKTFTTGEVLTASDTNTYLANSGLVYITSATFSTTALDGIFTSDYDNYRIVVRNVTQTGTNGLIQYNYRNTSNATDNSALYYTAGLRYDNGTAYNYSINTGTTAETAVNSAAGTSYIGFAMDIFSPRLAVNTMATVQGTGSITAISACQSSNIFNANTVFAGIIFKLSAGTITGGTVTVYGYRKA
jgi:hypothetical protein